MPHRPRRPNRIAFLPLIACALLLATPGAWPRDASLFRENEPPQVRLTVTTPRPQAGGAVCFEAATFDPDGDALRFTWTLDGLEQANAKGHAVTWQNATQGTHLVRVQVDDGHGGTASQELEFAVGPATGSSDIERALDANLNRVLDDDEILRAVQFWIAGSIVTGTDQTIDDATALELMGLWVTAAPID
jgi:hypothetical protein